MKDKIEEAAKQIDLELLKSSVSAMIFHCEQNDKENSLLNLLAKHKKTIELMALSQQSPLIGIEELQQRILNMKDGSGREGCSYGDTDYDSLSAVYGYNLALENVADILPHLRSTSNTQSEAEMAKHGFISGEDAVRFYEQMENVNPVSAEELERIKKSYNLIMSKAKLADTSKPTVDKDNK